MKVSLRAQAPRDLQVVITPSGTAGYELSAPHGATARFSFPKGAKNPGNASAPRDILHLCRRRCRRR